MPTGGARPIIYNPGAEIVSRKFTQLPNVQSKTAIGYLNEFVRRYSPGSKITNSTFNKVELHGSELRGNMILEVPVQNKPIPQVILDAAKARQIVIRDNTGKVLN